MENIEYDTIEWVNLSWLMLGGYREPSNTNLSLSGQWFWTIATDTYRYVKASFVPGTARDRDEEQPSTILDMVDHSLSQLWNQTWIVEFVDFPQ